MRNKLFKFLSLLFVLCMCLCFATACTDNGDNTNQNPEHVHAFNKQVISDNYLATKATCEQKATYYFSCSCGEKNSNTFSTGEPLGHNYGEFQYSGNGEHIKVCANDNNHVISENCKGGTATCNQYAKCEVCNSGYGDLLACVFENGQCKWCNQEFYTQGLVFGYTEYGSECYVADYVGNEKDVVIPAIYKGSPVKYISDFKSAFSGNTLIESVKIPKYVRSIKPSSFENCTSLKTIIFDKDCVLEHISGGAFFGCTSLTEFTMPNSVTSIYGNAFTDTSIKNLYLSDNLANVINPFDCETLEYNHKDNIKYLGSLTNPYLFLAGTDNKEITTANIDANCKIIGTQAFDGCESLKNAPLPNGLRTICECAFSECGLETLIIPDSVTTIGNYAFNYCPLVTVEIGANVYDLPWNIFSTCTSITNITVNETNPYYKSIDGNLYSEQGDSLLRYSVGKTETSFTIPNSVTYINAGAFYSSNNLVSIIIPESVIEIGDDAFSYCSSLQSVEIPTNTKIGERLFHRCSSLTSVILPSNIEEIPGLTFGDCFSLETIVIPNGVTHIGGFAFRNCPSLSTLIYHGSVTEWEKITKSEYWISLEVDTCATYVQCTDGKIKVN